MLFLLPRKGIADGLARVIDVPQDSTLYGVQGEDSDWMEQQDTEHDQMRRWAGQLREGSCARSRRRARTGVRWNAPHEARTKCMQEARPVNTCSEQASAREGPATP